jgi:Tfp pilus assembly protein PilO
VNLNLRALWATAQRWYATHSVRDRRIILALAGALGVSLVYLAIVDPIVDYRRRVAEEIAEGQEQLERAARFIGAVETLRAERAELRQHLTQAKARLLPGGSGTLGAAALQERANSLASEKGIAIQSTQVMKEEPADPFRKVAIRLTLMGELRQFTDFTAGLEYGPHQLTIPFVEVNRRGAVPGAKGPRTLSATVEVSGYLLAEAKPKVPEAEPAEAEGEAGGGAGEGEAAAGGEAAPGEPIPPELPGGGAGPGPPGQPPPGPPLAAPGAT